MTDSKTAGEPSDFVECVRELVDDIGQFLDWSRLAGAEALPADGRLPADERTALLKAPMAPARGASAHATGRPATERRGGEGSVRPAQRGATSSPKQPALGNWGAFVRPPSDTPTVGSLDRAETLDAVRSELGDCQRCGLCRGRRNIVFGVGSEQADLMVIGEGPGANEDRQGEPFVGQAGQMLDKMLLNVLQLRRDQVYIANVVKCRPPGNRNPEPEEIARCRPFLLAQMRVIQPKIVLVLGSVAARAMFDPSAGITRIRGTWRTIRFPGGEARAMPTFHPAYLLRQPGEKRKTFDDLKAVRAALGALRAE